jgi:hypothetical protein
MSAFGQKRTPDWRPLMSAIHPKADIRQSGRDVRFVPKADERQCSKSSLFNHLVGDGEQA